MRLIFALVFLGTVLLGAPAKGDDFTFSFTGTATGNVSGTVTGEILGLNDNTTGPAAQVLIESFPTDFDFYLGSAPINATLWIAYTYNSFTETGGVVTGGGFTGVNVIGDPATGASYLYINTSSSQLVFISLPSYVNTSLIANPGISFDNIQPLSSTVPEPSTCLLIGTGLLGLLAWAVRGKLHAPPASC
jgi:hypothetical protein